jgi:hypothetical protein
VEVDDDITAQSRRRGVALTEVVRVLAVACVGTVIDVDGFVI